MSGKDNRKLSRRHYCKPRLEQVRLVPEEAVLTGCKTNSVNGPTGKNCKFRGVMCNQKAS